MLVDAIILTGGRSSRLDSVPKSEFIVEQSTLLARTLNAASVARRIVVVGPAPATALPDGVMLVREEPPFSGPVAAVAAGVAALNSAPDGGKTQATNPGSKNVASDSVLVLACDMPHIGVAVPSLLTACEAVKDTDGVIAVDEEQRRQPLAAVYRTKALISALETLAERAAAAQHTDRLAGLGMFQLLDLLNLTSVDAPQDATADVDTWGDALRLGARPPATAAPNSTLAGITGTEGNKGNHHG